MTGDGRIWPLSAPELIAVRQYLGPAKPGTTAAMRARTLWHSLYDHALTADTSFYRSRGRRPGRAPQPSVKRGPQSTDHLLAKHGQSVQERP